MNTVFLGGSRSIKIIDECARNAIQSLVSEQPVVIIGDASGADTAIQQYLARIRYVSVEVYCSGSICRNNVGSWQTRSVFAPSKRVDFDFYAAKDRKMAERSSAGLMLWDGQSLGTLMNVFRLATQNKSVTIVGRSSALETVLTSHKDWISYLGRLDTRIVDKVRRQIALEQKSISATQPALAL